MYAWNWRTKLCRVHEAGLPCKFGDDCCFAHGIDKLRYNLKVTSHIDNRAALALPDLHHLDCVIDLPKMTRGILAVIKALDMSSSECQAVMYGFREQSSDDRAVTYTWLAQSCNEGNEEIVRHILSTWSKP
jgi:Zinc finger C-x8-C-x5-C-x3-H type (and similar)